MNPNLIVPETTSVIHQKTKAAWNVECLQEKTEATWVSCSAFGESVARKLSHTQFDLTLLV